MERYNLLEINTKLALMSNYYKWIYSLAEKYIRENIIDCGCGVGNMFPYLRYKKRVIGFESNRDLINTLKYKYSKYLNFSFYEIFDLLWLNAQFLKLVYDNGEGSPNAPFYNHPIISHG